MEKLIERVKTLAAKKARFDNDEFNACDWSGGNFDDAYSMGVEDGEISLARELLKVIENKG